MALATSISRIFAAGALCAAFLTTGAPTAMADQSIACAPGQIVIDGQCQVPTNQNNTHPGDTGGGTDSGGNSHSGGHGH